MDNYSKWFGQKINWRKYEIFFFNTPLTKQREISSILGMQVGNLPGKYLGIPFFGGESRSSIWKNLVDSCIQRMDGWKRKWMTLVGRIMMLKMVISAILLFSMMCLQILQKVVKVIEQKMRVFLEWSSGEG